MLLACATAAGAEAPKKSPAVVASTGVVETVCIAGVAGADSDTWEAGVAGGTALAGVGGADPPKNEVAMALLSAGGGTVGAPKTWDAGVAVGVTVDEAGVEGADAAKKDPAVLEGAAACGTALGIGGIIGDADKEGIASVGVLTAGGKESKEGTGI